MRSRTPTSEHSKGSAKPVWVRVSGSRTCNPVAAVVLTLTAVADLERLTTTHSLPTTTRDRVKSSLGPVTTSPLLGPPLPGRWQGLPFILGPWSWMLLVYAYDEETDQGSVVTIHHARSAESATSQK